MGFNRRYATKESMGYLIPALKRRAKFNLPPRGSYSTASWERSLPVNKLFEK
jgi:hypothetical protein